MNSGRKLKKNQGSRRRPTRARNEFVDLMQLMRRRSRYRPYSLDNPDSRTTTENFYNLRSRSNVALSRDHDYLRHQNLPIGTSRHNNLREEAFHELPPLFNEIERVESQDMATSTEIPWCVVRLPLLTHSTEVVEGISQLPSSTSNDNLERCLSSNTHQELMAIKSSEEAGIRDDENVADSINTNSSSSSASSNTNHLKSHIASNTGVSGFSSSVTQDCQLLKNQTPHEEFHLAPPMATLSDYPKIERNIDDILPFSAKKNFATKNISISENPHEETEVVVSESSLETPSLVNSESSTNEHFNIDRNDPELLSSIVSAENINKASTINEEDETGRTLANIDTEAGGDGHANIPSLVNLEFDNSTSTMNTNGTFNIYEWDEEGTTLSEIDIQAGGDGPHNNVLEIEFTLVSVQNEDSSDNDEERSEGNNTEEEANNDNS